VARSIGDHVASTVGVFAEPEVTSRRVECPGDGGGASSQPAALLLGSDGVPYPYPSPYPHPDP